MRKIRMILLVISLLMLTGCFRKEVADEEGEYNLYYTNLDVTSLSSEVYDAKGETTEELIAELLDALNQEPKKHSNFLLMNDTVYVSGHVYDGSMVTIYMTEPYRSMPKTKEVLVRAGLVRTLVQIDGVDFVRIYVGDAPLTDSKGKEIGPMNARTFIENSGKEINSYKSADIELFFTNEEGNRLVSERRSLYYSSNIQLEQIIVEQLISGPKIQGNYPTIPFTASILSVTVVDDTCYVNLNKSFLEQPLNVQQEIPIYSISQSLIQNCKVSRVQFAIEGESELIFRESMSLNQFYEKNNALLLEEN